MGIFSKGRSPSRVRATGVVPAAELARLGQVGRVVYVDGGFADVSAFYLPAFQRLGLPIGEFAERLVLDLTAGAAAQVDDWAFPGALYVAIDFDGPEVANRPGGDALIDSALRVLVARGVSGVLIPNFVVPRWNAIRSGTV